MPDRLQITFPIDDWRYIVEGTITEDNTAFIYAMVTCQPECPFYKEGCLDHQKCIYDNDIIVEELLNRYEDRMVNALKAAARELGIDVKVGGKKC